MQDSWVLFIDLVKAFDTVNRTALIAILRNSGYQITRPGRRIEPHEWVLRFLRTQPQRRLCFGAAALRTTNRAYHWPGIRITKANESSGGSAAGEGGMEDGFEP